jgi:hypothetical protein
MLPRCTMLTTAATGISAFAVPRRLQPDTAAGSRRDEAMTRLEREDAGICTMDLSRAGTKSPGSFPEALCGTTPHENGRELEEGSANFVKADPLDLIKPRSMSASACWRQFRPAEGR